MEWDKIERLSQVESACILFQGWYFTPGVWENWVNILEEQYDVVLLWDIYNPPSDDVWCHLRSLVGLVDLYAWSLGGMFAMELAAKYPGFINELITFNSFPCFAAKKNWPGAPDVNLHDFSNGLNDPSLMRRKFLLPSVLGGNNNKKELAYLQKNIHDVNNIKNHVDLLNKLFTLDHRETWSKLTCKQIHFVSEADNIVKKEIYQAWQNLPNYAPSLSSSSISYANKSNKSNKSVISNLGLDFMQDGLSVPPSIKWVSVPGHSHSSFLLDPQIYVKVLEKEYESESVD